MWPRWIRDLRVELYWMKRDLSRRWQLDTPTRVVGILTLILGVLLLIVIGDGVAHIFRGFIPLGPFSLSCAWASGHGGSGTRRFYVSYRMVGHCVKYAELLSSSSVWQPREYPTFRWNV